jgi:hypothetical protein
VGKHATRGNTGHRTAVITLVHGTFARDARWTLQDSALSAALRKAGCHVTRFAWSGRNSHRARSQAAGDLVEHLRQQLAEHPRAGALKPLQRRSGHPLHRL